MGAGMSLSTLPLVLALVVAAAVTVRVWWGER